MTDWTAATASSPRAITSVMLPLMLVLFISTLDQTIVAAALGRMGHVLGDPSAVPWVATTYLLTSAVTTLIFGKLGDMIGRKPVLQVGIAIFVVGSLLCAFAPSMLWLAVFRALQGIGGGGLSSLSMTVVGELVPARERARYQAMLGVVPALAVILGPVVGGLIVDYWDWPWIFLINVPIGFLAFALIAARLHLPRRHHPRRLDVCGGVLVTVFTSAVLGVVVEGGQRFAWHSLPTLLLALTAGVSFVAYLWAEHRAAEPLTPLHLFGNCIFILACLLFFLSTAVLFVGMLFVPLMLQRVFGLTALAAGASIVPLLLGLITATIVTGAVITKTGRYKRFPIIGAVLAAVGLYAMSRVELGTSMAMMLVLLTLIGVGLGFFIQVTVLAGQNAVSHQELGVATGVLNFFKTLGGAVGAAVFGAVLAAAYRQLPDAMPEHAVHAFQSVFVWSLPLMGVALMLAVMMPEKPLSDEVREIAEGKIDVPEY
jgi:EmrB/QacA subfamily drug resistance transporter